MQLEIQSNIQNELIQIIHKAIDCQKIDTESIRMIVLCADDSFQKLEVCIKNEWDYFFQKEYASVIGEINISQWLDVADAALKNQQQIDASYIERAKQFEDKYQLTPPAISFAHLDVLSPAYVAFLVCLREELLKQVHAGISNAATSFPQTYFKNVVSFFTHKLTYNNQNENILLHAFSHPEGAGTFYKVAVKQPEHIHSKRFLRFHETGFHLFHVDFPESEAESQQNTEVTSYDISEIAFMYLQDNEVFFRPNSAFQNWKIEPGRTRPENGDKTEQDLLNAFEHFFNTFPDKVFNPKNIPDPISKKQAFDHWFNIVLEYNIQVIYAHLKTIFNYGENAYRYYLQLIPKAHPQQETAMLFWASRLFYSNRFQEALDAFDRVQKRTESEQIEYLCALYLLDQKERYETYRSTATVEKQTLELLDILWIIRASNNTDALNLIEKNTALLAAANKNRRIIRLISLVLVKVYTLQNNKEQALFHLQFIPTDEAIEQLLLRNEFKSVPYILEAYEQLVQKKKSRLSFEERTKNHALDTSNKKKTDAAKTLYEHSYYVKHKIRVSDYKWACPVNAETFIAIKEDNGYQLILAKIISGQSLEILQQRSIPTSRKAGSAVYLDGIVYIADVEHGIVTYTVTETYIEETSVVYKNVPKRSRYETITIAGDYLFASNNSYLEIFHLHQPEAGVLSDSLYIGSGYHLAVHNDLLVVGAGAGLLILADISDKNNPEHLSTIQEDFTPNNMPVAFIDSYMVTRSVYNISNPREPKWIQYVGEEFAPVYYFSSKPEVPIISTGEDFLFTTLTLKDNKPVYTNWLESLDKDHDFYERATYNLATAYFEDAVITYCRYDIILWEKGLSPAIETIDIHHEVETMVANCLDFISNEHHSFRIGKAVLQYDPLYQHIDISFHQSSSLAVLTNSNITHSLPIISSTLLLYKYCKEVLNKDYQPTRTKFVYDGNAIIKKLIRDYRFADLSAQHVLALAENNGTYIYDPAKPWQPFRINTTVETKEETVTEIILSRNDASINQLTQNIANSTALLNELLDILNKKVFVPEITSEVYEDMDSDTEMHSEEEEEVYCSPEYIVDPYYAPENKPRQNNSIPSGFLPNTMETFDLKNKAFEILCKLSDRLLVRTILFNGMKFGYLHYNLKDLPAAYSINENVTTEFVRNNHGTWNDFGADSDIRFFLMSNINAFSNARLKIRIVYKCGHWSHPLISDYIREIIDSGMLYENFRGVMTDIDLSTFPPEAIKPFESLLLEKSALFENATEPILLIDAEQQLPYIYALLYKIGYEHMPEIVRKKLIQAVKEVEEYNHHELYDEDEYESDITFLTRFYREIKTKRLLHYYQTASGALWPLTEPLELYEESWNRTIEELLQQGIENFGDSFRKNYIERLVKNISLDEMYANDRVFAYEFIQYAYRTIPKKPELASIVEPLVLAVNKYKDIFPSDLNIVALKDKNKYTLLQAAWNDLKDSQLDLADQKADAVLIMDPAMKQVYFLKARLLWLCHGTAAYLEQQEYFIEKAEGDTTALVRLYNLTGCALDAEKRYEDALPYFKKAALLEPAESMYVSNIAEVYYKLGKSKEAVQYARSAHANGCETVILKEIIANKGVLSST